MKHLKIFLITLLLAISAKGFAEAETNFYEVKNKVEYVYTLTQKINTEKGVITYVRLKKVYPQDGFSGALTIPSKRYEGSSIVTAIGDEVTSSDKITSISIGDSIKTIGERAFYNCKNVTSVSLGTKVSKIGAAAFKSCTSLTKIEIKNQSYPYSLSEIGESAFENCSSLTEIKVYKGTKLKTTNAFPYDIAKIQDATFKGCTSLTSFTIPKTVTEIGASAFEGCTGLTTFTIPSNVTKIGAAAFKGCTGFTTFTIPSSVTSMGGNVFKDCTNLTSVTIPSSITKINNGTFNNCTSLPSFTIQSTVTEIGDSAFYNCTSLGDLIFPTALTTIGSNACYNCKCFTELTLPKNLTSIGEKAFASCSNLCTITVDIDDYNNVFEIADNTFDDAVYKKALFKVSSELQYTFRTTNGWRNFLYINSYGTGNDVFQYTVKSSVSKTVYLASYHNQDISGNLTVPSSVTGSGCWNSNTYTVKGVSNYAFYKCSEITSITLPSTIIEIGSHAFAAYDPEGVIMEGDSKLKSVNIPDGVTKIKKYTFAGCAVLGKMTLPDGLTSIGEGAFYNCSKMPSINIPSNISVINDETFYGCTRLSSIDLPSKVSSIGSSAFSCSGLTSITIPTNTTAIGGGAFASCEQLQNVAFNEKVSTIGRYAFGECTNLKQAIELPNSVKEIGDRCFWESGITSIQFSTKMTSIPSEVCYFCKNLETVIIPSNITSIDARAFCGCTALKSVYSYITDPFEIDNSVFDKAVGAQNDFIYNNATLYVPKGTKTKYENTSSWKKFFKIVEMDGTTDITSVDANKDDDEVVGIYNINGTRAKELQRGVNIIKTKDGKTKKVIKR